MATFRLSRLAEADLMDISAYTLQAWGLDQTIRYIDGLETCCQHLADNPGQAASAIISGRACAAWNMPGMSCFIGSNQGVS